MGDPSTVGPKYADDELVSLWAMSLIQQGFYGQNKLTITWRDPSNAPRKLETEDERKKRIAKDARVPHSIQAAQWWGRKLIKAINVEMCDGAGPKDYRRRWGHSYFGYVMAGEFQKNGTPHLHIVVDNWLPYSFIHDWCAKYTGFAHIDQVKDGLHDLKYALKYCMKGGMRTGDVQIFLQKNRHEVQLREWMGVQIAQIKDSKGLTVGAFGRPHASLA